MNQQEHDDVVVKLAGGNQRLEYAIRSVLGRMAGCGSPNCGACNNNVSALEELVKVAREDKQ